MSVRLLGVIALLFALGSAAVLTNSAFRRKQIMRKISERVEGTDRYVDVGVTVCAVVTDTGPAGLELIPDKLPVRVVGERRHLGGIVDTKSCPPHMTGSQSHRWWTDDSKQPPPGAKVWYLSEDQALALFFAIDNQDPRLLCQLVYGSEGSGKTRLLGMFHFCMWLLHLGEYREGGQTSPTNARAESIRREMFALFSPNWFRYRIDEGLFTMCDGTRIRLVSTQQQSAKQGSRIQSYSFSWLGRDELQDQVEAHEDCESRGRAAKTDVATKSVLYRQMATATAKDDTKWRELREALMGSGRWVRRELSIFRSPFTAPGFLADKALTMSEREFRRRYGDPLTGEVDDLVPELAVYYAWNSTRNLVVRPQIASDVTGNVLSGYASYLHKGRGFGLLCGHDPGAIFNTTEVMSLLMFNGTPTWVVVGELQTKQTTQHEHAKQLVSYLREKFYVNHPTVDGPLAITFCDPHGKGEGQTDYQSVYMAFQKEGLDVFDPAPVTKRIKRRARIEMVNRLLGAQAPRLVVAHVHGTPVAPRLVEALKSLQKRPGDDDPEGTQRKDINDQTHAPCAASYCLWPFEQEALTASTVAMATRTPR